MLFKIVLMVIALLPLSAKADRYCFTLAESYYQQVYCEVKASGKGSGLPSFYDFRRNDEMMQALLLKPYARRMGLELKLPQSTSQITADRQAINNMKSQVPALDTLAGCERDKNIIVCSGARYQLVGNRSNKWIDKNALSNNNAMALLVYRGNLKDSQSVSRYLQKSYHHYLQKMIEIGLGGATLSYGKFAFLFSDLNAKDVSFSGRFEKMYGYLKKDKQSMAVPSKSEAPDGLELSDCYPLESLLVCGFAMNNWLFEKQ